MINCLYLLKFGCLNGYARNSTMKKIVIGLLSFILSLSVYALIASVSPAYAQLYPPTCAENGGVCDEACVSPDVPISGTCANALLECCGTYVPPNCTAPAECRGTCLTSQLPTIGACANDAYTCCFTPTSTPTPVQTCTGECRGTCLTTQVVYPIGICSNTSYNCCNLTEILISPRDFQ